MRIDTISNNCKTIKSFLCYMYKLTRLVIGACKVTFNAWVTLCILALMLDKLACYSSPGISPKQHVALFKSNFLCICWVLRPININVMQSARIFLPG